MADGQQRGKGVAFACVVGLGFEERKDEVGSVGNQGIRMLVDGGNRPNSVFPHIGVPMVQTRASGGQERFEEFGLS
jgi:hypothetical protein